MKERPILFNSEMVRAIQDGRKTQTRRTKGLEYINNNPEGWTVIQDAEEPEAWNFYADNFGKKIKCPYGKPGDRLYVKEAWCENFDGSKIHYKADGGESPGPKGFWRNSRFMFKKHARIWTEITDIREERVQDINNDDIIAEGIIPFEGIANRGLVTNWIELWNRINYKRGYGWDVNPYVWVIEFKRIKP